MNIQKAVAESYIHLASTRLSEPSIDEVVAHAGVTREDFVSYYADLRAVVMVNLEEMLWMLQGSNMPRRLDEGNFGPDAARSICDDIVARVSDTWQPVVIGVRHHRADVQLAIGRAIQNRAAAYFDAYPAFRHLDDVFLATASHYVGHGLAAIVTGWISGEVPSDPTSVADHMTALLPGWLTDPTSVRNADEDA